MSYSDRALTDKDDAISLIFQKSLRLQPPKGPKQTKGDGNCFFTSVADALNEINDQNCKALGLSAVTPLNASNVKEHLKSILTELEQFYKTHPLNEAMITSDGVVQVNTDVGGTFTDLRRDLEDGANNWQTTKTCQVVADAFNLNIKLLIVYKGAHGFQAAETTFSAAGRSFSQDFASKRMSIRGELLKHVGSLTDTVNINLAMYTGVQSASEAGSEMVHYAAEQGGHFMSLLDITPSQKDFVKTFTPSESERNKHGFEARF